MTNSISPTCIQSLTPDMDVTAPPDLRVCCHLWGNELKCRSSQTVIRTQNISALPTLNHYQHTFRMQASSSLRCLILYPFSSPFPPSSTPPVPHSLRSSGKFLTFVTKNKELKICIHCQIAGHARETCGVFRPAGPPRSLHQLPHCYAEVQPSVEYLCACLPNSHEDLSLWHKFI